VYTNYQLCTKSEVAIVAILCSLHSITNIQYKKLFCINPGTAEYASEESHNVRPDNQLYTEKWAGHRASFVAMLRLLYSIAKLICHAVDDLKRLKVILARLKVILIL